MQGSSYVECPEYQKRYALTGTFTSTFTFPTTTLTHSIHHPPPSSLSLGFNSSSSLNRQSLHPLSHRLWHISFFTFSSIASYYALSIVYTAQRQSIPTPINSQPRRLPRIHSPQPNSHRTAYLLLHHPDPSALDVRPSHIIVAIHSYPLPAPTLSIASPPLRTTHTRLRQTNVPAAIACCVGPPSLGSWPRGGAARRPWHPRL